MTQTETPLWRKTHFRGLWNSDLPLDLKFSLSKGLFSGREAFIFAAARPCARSTWRRCART